MYTTACQRRYDKSKVQTRMPPRLEKAEPTGAGLGELPGFRATHVTRTKFFACQRAHLFVVASHLRVGATESH